MMNIDKDQRLLKAMEEVKKNPLEDEEDRERKLRELNKKMAFAQTHNFYSLIGRLSQIKILKEIHDSKLYKLECSEFEEFCQRHFNRGRQSVYDELKIVRVLTKNFVAISDKIGFSYRTIRLISRLSQNRIVAVGDKTITIGDTTYPLIPENKREIQEAIAELENQLMMEKQRAKGYKKMMSNRDQKVDRLEQEVAYLRNPNPHKTEIEHLIDKADANITIGMAQFVNAAQMIIKWEEETGERTPEREKFMALLGKVKMGLIEAIENAEQDLGEISMLEIKEIYKRLGYPMPQEIKE